MLLEPAEHLARRKLLLPPFHGERVRGYGELMQRLMDEEVDRWRPGRPVAVMPAMLNVTIEVILQVVLGVRDPDLRAELRRLIDDVLVYPFGGIRRWLYSRPAPRLAPPHRIRALMAFMTSLPTPAVSTYFPELKERTWLNPGTVRWWRYRDRLMALLAAQIAATRSNPGIGERDDILATLVQAATSRDRRWVTRSCRTT
jgi:cytochrome P450